MLEMLKDFVFASLVISGAGNVANPSSAPGLPSQPMMSSSIALPARCISRYSSKDFTHLHSPTLGKRVRSTSSANCSAASPVNTRPTKRLARLVQAAAPYAKRRGSPIEHFSRCSCSPNVARHPRASARIRTRRAHSVDPLTPPHLRSLSPHALQRRRARSLNRNPTPLRLI